MMNKKNEKNDSQNDINEMPNNCLTIKIMRARIISTS